MLWKKVAARDQAAAARRLVAVASGGRGTEG